jgi:hypothetical protein
VWILQRTDNLGIFYFGLGDVLAQGPQSNCGTIKDKRSWLLSKLSENSADTTGAINVFHMPFASRADFAQMRNPGRNFVDSLQ